MEIYNKLGLKPHYIKDKEKLNKSVYKYFNISSVHNFNTNLTYFSIHKLNSKTFNNTRQVVKILRKKKHIHINGSLYTCQLKYRNKYYINDVFIKESPIINPLFIQLDYKNISNTDQYSYENYMLNDLIINKNNSSNIELFVNYILSKLVDLDLSVHFSHFYGFNIVTMNKFTSHYESHLNLTKYSKKYNFTIYKNYIQRTNLPTILIYTEKLNSDLYRYILTKHTILEHEWSCYIFQIISALTIIQKQYNLYHNDLHTSNIMYKNTDQKYIYYKYNNKYYRLHTYGKILKIIDWGRSTYDFNNYKGLNNVFSSDGDVFGQYIYNKINNTGKQPIYPNPNSDLVIFGSNIIVEPTFPKKGALFNLVLGWLHNKPSILYKNLFKIYKFSSTCNSSIPKEQIESNVFYKFLINKKMIPTNSKIYSLD